MEEEHQDKKEQPEKTDIEIAKALIEELYQFNRCYFQTHNVEDAEKKDYNVQLKMEETVKQLQLKEDTLPRPIYQYLRGKALNVLPTYSKEAEQLLSQAVKSSPSLVDAWNSLGESYWKAGNISQAHHCFTGALSHEVNKESLRNLSMVLRQIGKDATEKKANTRESLEKAKQAVSLDVKDGTSWMVLGNAYLAIFFTVEQDPKMLQQCRTAYNQAEKDPVTINNPDLHFNIATLQLYEEEYTIGLDHLEQACRLDPGWSTPQQKLQSMKQFLQSYSQLIGARGKLKPKKLATLQQSVLEACEARSTEESGDIVCIRELREGGDERGKGTVLIGVVGSCLTTEDRVPLACVLVDKNGDSIGMTVYNLAHSFQFNIGDVLIVPNPILSHIHIPNLNVEYDNIRYTQPHNILCNGKVIPQEKISSSIAQVTAFS